MDLRFDVREWGAVQGGQSNALVKYTLDAEKTQHTSSYHLACSVMNSAALTQADFLLYYWLAIIH